MTPPSPKTRRRPAITLTSVYHSAGFYPITGLYLVAVAVAVAVAQGLLLLQYALIILAFIFVTVLLAATLRELKVVHKLVNGQRAELLDRIDLLAALLVSNGQEVPTPGDKEQDARDDRRREGNDDVALADEQREHDKETPNHDSR